MKIVKDLDLHEKLVARGIIVKLNQLRKELEVCTNHYGITHELTIKKSQEIDRVMNELLKESRKRKLEKNV